MRDLSIIIPARNEEFLQNTIDNILAGIKEDTEIIVVLDGCWPEKGIKDHPQVRLIHYSKSIGQRAATNQGARLSTARYIMKLDAHCAVAEGFDTVLIESGEMLGKDVTQIPRMYNLHAFDWTCTCGHHSYQGPKPHRCPNCKEPHYSKEIIWKPRLSRKTDFTRFDSHLRFGYWGECENREGPEKQIAEVMGSLGACFFMRRERFWEIDGLDEEHGSWGQFGTEISCKSWLSGGRQVVNKKTWFAHMFRTQKGFGFPYPISGKQVDHARSYSKKLWQGNSWPKAKRSLSWLISRFSPVPGWEGNPTKLGLVYYTDNRPAPEILSSVRNQLLECSGGSIDIVSVSLNPIAFGKNIHFKGERGILTMFKQILAGLEQSTSEIIFLCEHDILYHPSHFSFVPIDENTFYYNMNVWKFCIETGRCLHYLTKQTSGLCAHRNLLLKHYRARVKRVEKDGFSRRMGFEPGCHRFPRGVDNYPSEQWWSEYPNIDIRHKHNLTKSRWSQDQFRNHRACKGWTTATSIPGWGTNEMIKHYILQGQKW